MSIAVKIYDTDSARDIARKIFEEFDVMSSCCVYGFVEKDSGLIAKGEYVIEYLKMFDEMENLKFRGEKAERNFKYRKDSIGGPIAHKIFTWEMRIVESEPRYTIWRYQ